MFFFLLLVISSFFMIKNNIPLNYSTRNLTIYALVKFVVLKYAILISLDIKNIEEEEEETR